MQPPIKQQLKACQQRYPHGAAMLLVAEADAERIPALQQYARELDYPIFGAVFPALLDGEDFHLRGIHLLPLPQCPAHALIDLKAAPQAPDQAIARLLEALAIPHHAAQQATLCLLFDALVPNIASLLETLYLQLGDRVGYAGANAGSERFAPIPCLFDSHRFTDQAVLAILLPPSHQAVLEHGYRGGDSGMIATSTASNKVSHIEWRPAIEVYQELVQQQFGLAITRENFYQHAVHLPFGIRRLNGEVVVRIPIAIEEDGSLHCVGEVPENVLLTLLEAPVAGSGETVAHLCNGLLGRHCDDLLLFYCAGRRLHLGEDARDELTLLQRGLGNGSLRGALSLGEIGQSQGDQYPLFHNAALLALPWCR